MQQIRINLVMRSIIFIIFTFSTCLVSLAQVKTSNNDLRVMREIFSLTDLSEKKPKVYTLMTSSSGGFNMIIRVGNKQSEKWKVDSDHAQALDDRFADDFINMKYIMTPNDKIKCGEKYSLNLRGEDQNICPHENNKVKKIKELIAYLNMKIK